MLRLIILLSLFFSTPVWAQSPTPKTDPEAIADLRVARGQKDIAEAWLVAPTKRYAHFVQGSQYEAGGVRVKLRSGKVLTLMLGNNQVFEDRQPRLADLDGDGKDEIILVLTSLKKGASLAALSVQNGAIKLKAQTPHIGKPYRWLNPAGIADFDGDGKVDVALVAMPHLVKRLELWSLAAGKFKRWGNYPGYSNHRNGSTYTSMAVVADFNGDGTNDLALPGADRRSVKIVSLKGRKLELLKSLQLPAAADGRFTFKRGALSIGLGTGAIVRVTP